ncbi:unnamed protein product, partial [marine sediment metagenome]
WDETITKARALLAGISVTQDGEQRIVDIQTINKKSEKISTKQNAGKSFS